MIQNKVAGTLTILGCGTSTGVPRMKCGCKVCRSKNPKNQRLRASVWVKTPRASILVDTSPDLRAQAIRAKIPRLDAVLYTHAHADHLHGIDDLRSFNFIQEGVIPLYATPRTCGEIRNRFPYIFDDKTYVGGGKPRLDLREFSAKTPEMNVAGIAVTPLAVEHGPSETIAFRFGSIAYVTDTSYIPPQSLERLQGLSVLVLDCLQNEPHRTHLNLDQALAVVKQLRPARTVLTHLGHDFDGSRPMKGLPKGVSLAYDGMKLRFEVKQL